MLEWSVAGLECRALHKDAHLLVINDAAEQSAVAALLAPISGKNVIRSLLILLLLTLTLPRNCIHDLTMTMITVIYLFK